MTTYHMPPEPTVDVLWTCETNTTPVRWTRGTDQAGAPAWQSESEDATWPALLARGPVFDQHPSLPADYPLPWSAEYDGDAESVRVVDAGGNVVNLNHDHVLDEIGSFIVRAVNELAARIEAS
jgi:hypothetical protein